MRLLYVILAHDNPEQARDLAVTLRESSGDGSVAIHFDANAPAAAFSALGSLLAGEERIRLVRNRVRCGWGSFGLVQAVLSTLAEVREAGDGFDYVVLLSGACMPCRPIAQLERFLGENRGREFIEDGDERWPKGGLRLERFHFHFPLPALRYPAIDRLSVNVQRFLGVRRRIPDKLEPRFGSQWWTLTWPTCLAVLDYVAAHPEVVRFFRRTWIPDELMFPTLVHRLVPQDRIAGFTLTRYTFTDKGKPVVYYDDHGDHPLAAKSFFVRKVSPEATRLRARCLSLAREPDDGRPLDEIGAPSRDYEFRIAAASVRRPPGELFSRDQFVDRPLTVLRRMDRPYVVLFGPPAIARQVLDRVAGAPGLVPLGRVFAPGEVDLGPGVDGIGGLNRGDAAIRDAHPALFLVRLRARCAATPVMAIAPGDGGDLVAAVAEDPRALVVSFAPATYSPDVALAALSEGIGAPPPEIPGVSQERMQAAAALVGWGGDEILQMEKYGSSNRLVKLVPEKEVPKVEFDDTPVLPQVLFLGDAASPAGRLLRRPLPLGGAGDDHRREALFERSVAASAFAHEPWFGHLVAALEAAVPIGREPDRVVLVGSTAR